MGGYSYVEVHATTNDALAELAQNMISTDGVLKNVSVNIRANVTDLTPLSGLKHIKGGKLDVSYTTNLASLAPLENLEVVDGDLVISYNDAVTDISLPSLTEVDGDLWIRYNEALTDASLPSLTEVGGDLYVNYNDVLASGEYQPSHTAPLFFAFSLTNLHFIYCVFVTVSLPKLSSVGNFNVDNNAGLTELEISHELLDENTGNIDSNVTIIDSFDADDHAPPNSYDNNK